MIGKAAISPALHQAAAALVVALAALSALACDITGVDTERFVIQVDSIAAPDTVDANQAFEVRFFGGIGPDLCSRLDRVETRREAGLLEVRFHGERSVEGSCLHLPAALDHVETVEPPFEDAVAIRAFQPDGHSLTEVVEVR